MTQEFDFGQGPVPAYRHANGGVCTRRCEVSARIERPSDDAQINVLAAQALPFALQTATERADALGITVRVYLGGKLERIVSPRITIPEAQIRETHRRWGLEPARGA